MRFEFEAIRRSTQESLVQFLSVELELGSTLVQSALLAHGNPEHHEQAKDSALRAAETVERFKSHVVDGKARNEIGKGLALLQKQITAL